VDDAHRTARDPGDTRSLSHPRCPYLPDDWGQGVGSEWIYR
jgi:hypothetical protein